MSSEELQQAHEGAWRLLDALEEMLAPGQPFICGDSFSVADVFTVPMLARLQWRNHGQQIRCGAMISTAAGHTPVPAASRCLALPCCVVVLQHTMLLLHPSVQSKAPIGFDAVAQ